MTILSDNKNLDGYYKYFCILRDDIKQHLTVKTCDYITARCIAAPESSANRFCMRRVTG